MKLIVVLCAVALAGCAAQVVSTSPRSVVVSGPDTNSGTAAAQKLADAECAKHQRFARLIGRPGATSTQFVFDCVQ